MMGPYDFFSRRDKYILPPYSSWLVWYTFLFFIYICLNPCHPNRTNTSKEVPYEPQHSSFVPPSHLKQILHIVLNLYELLWIEVNVFFIVMFHCFARTEHILEDLPFFG